LSSLNVAATMPYQSQKAFKDFFNTLLTTRS
jgi:hypothetical protein